MKRMLGIAVALTVMALGAMPALAAGDVPGEVLRVRDSLYRISTQDDEYEYSGSGFIVASDGNGTYIATNYHVVEDTYQDSIMVTRHDGSRIRADIAAFDAGHDLCVLKTAAPIPDALPLPLADEASDTGDAVYALGFPGAGDYLMNEETCRPEDVTVTDGFISAVKHATIGDAEITFLQMNAAINPGSSGGPLVNSRGQVAGVNTLGILDANDVFAAVSVQHLITLLDESGISYRTGSLAGQEESAGTGPGMVWIVLLGALGGILVTALGSLILFRRRNRLTLAQILTRRGRGFTPDQALAMLEPVLRVLHPLHIRGEAHGAIYPGNLYINRQGVLVPGRRRRPSPGTAAGPFLALEQYGGAPAGPHTDVYALGAVIYHMLTGREPDDMLTRLQHDTVPDGLGTMEALSPALAGTILEAMAPRKETRIHDAAALSAALGISAGPVLPAPSDSRPSSAMNRANFSLAFELMSCNAYIYNFLVGTWKGDGKYFTMTNSGSYKFYSTYDIPGYDGDSFLIEDLEYKLGSTRSGYKAQFRFYIVNANCIQIYAYKNGYTYTLYRQG